MAEIRKAKIYLDVPRFETGAPMRIVGISERYSFDNTQGIAAQWQRFRTLYEKIPHIISERSVGVSIPTEKYGIFDYICAMEVSRFSPKLPEFVQHSIPEQYYAVFSHYGHVSRISETYRALQEYPPPCNAAFRDAPWIERQMNAFDPQTGKGGIEIWVPVEFVKSENM